MEAGRELDALIAEKVMGWTEIEKVDVRYSSVPEFQGIMPNERPSQFTGYKPKFKIPEYSTDIAAAFSVLYKACNDRQLGWQIEQHESDNELFVILKGHGTGEHYEHNGIARERNPELDLSWYICLAALKAVEGNNVEK